MIRIDRQMIDRMRITLTLQAQALSSKVRKGQARNQLSGLLFLPS